MLEELVIKNRSYRRFYQNKTIDNEQLKCLINIGRLTASGANKQPVRYILSNEAEKNERIFGCLRGRIFRRLEWPERRRETVSLYCDG